MSKYEIMIIVDPKADLALAQKLLKEVFGKNVEKAQKLERTELAYKINNAQHAQYLLAEVQSEPSLIAEFTRKANIVKEIWRYLVLNLDTERGYGKEFKNVGKNKVDPRVTKNPKGDIPLSEEPKKRVYKTVKTPTSKE
ncbi:30S ribosomal protein S6 [Mycoplasmopsis citelli]|uniref:Small ribosomal subunit protein bS6 n=1 Tax=Mycoplasmopsis citelli TaxID=171281 RepID=A0A449B0Z2_9BACT|nr:30S ribosomal protein S6 [Mycoplasmopsis citelli]UUD36628.1 30S ribosomal protein S6 [Mycoplasmopsis citelli]VEU74267.1 30S ribosomal protein S6 [Mycoplasmopsis citelli]